MQRDPSSRISVLLLDTLRKFERKPDSPHDDPAMAGLERYVLRLVGELDAIKRDSDRSPPAVPMSASTSSKVVEILRNAVDQIEQMSGAPSDVANLKENLVRAMAELESGAAVQTPFPAPPAFPAPPGNDRFTEPEIATEKPAPLQSKQGTG